MDSPGAFLALAGTNVLLALSLSLTLSCGVISLAGAAFMGIGAYATALLLNDWGWSSWMVLPAAGAAATVVALPLGIPVARLPTVFATIVTFGFGEVASQIMVSMPVSGLLDPSASAVAMQWWALPAALLLATYVVMQVGRSRIGHAFLAIREDPVLAASLGINVSLHKLIGFLLGAFIAGVAGGVAVLLDVGGAAALFGIERSVDGLEAAVIGGISASWGPWSGALVLTLLPSMLQPLLALAGVSDPTPLTSSLALRQITGGAVTLLVVLGAPGGISGSIVRWRRRRRAVAAAAPASPRPAAAEAAALLPAQADQPIEGEPDPESEGEPEDGLVQRLPIEPAEPRRPDAPAFEARAS